MKTKMGGGAKPTRLETHVIVYRHMAFRLSIDFGASKIVSSIVWFVGLHCD